MVQIECERYLGFYNTQGLYNIPAKQYDTGRKFVFNIVGDNGEPYDISNASVYLRVLKADGNQFQSSECCEIIDNTVVVDCSKTDQLLTSPGINEAEIHFSDSIIGLTTWKFNILVEKRVHDGTNIVSTSEWDKLDALMELYGQSDDFLEWAATATTIADAESSRINVEKVRVIAESDRVAAENERVTEFNTLKSASETATTGAEKVNISSTSATDSYKLNITNRNGTTTSSPNLLNKIGIGTVETGDYDENATVTITGNFGSQKLNFRIPTGVPFKIAKTYTSVTNMNADFSGTDTKLYDFVIINTGNVQDVDNAKMYMKGETTWMYLTDLSGAQGIQGNKGNTGATPNLTIGTVTTGAEGTNATVTLTGTTDNPVLNFVIPKGDTGTFSVVTQSTNGLMTSTDKKRMDSEGKFANCTTLRNVVAKVVNCENFVLQTGSSIYVKFTDSGSSNATSGNITLNVNGTGAKNVFVSQSNDSLWQSNYSHGAYFIKNQVHEFVYDGTQWIMFIGGDNKPTSADATTSATGLMSISDKIKLNNIDDNANNYSLPIASESLGGVKNGGDVIVDETGNMSADINNQTPTYKDATTLSTIVSGETISTAFGKLKKAISDYIVHKTLKATTSIIGHVSAGTGLSVDANGVLTVKYGTAVGTSCQGNDSRLSDSRTPTSHASTGTSYGVGTASNYGHVKLSDTYTSNVGDSSNSLAASQSSVYNAYNSLNNKFAKGKTAAGLNYRYTVCDYVDINAGQSNWTINQFTFYRDIDMSKIIAVILTKSACTNGSNYDMDIVYRTYDGDHSIYFYTPVATRLFFNMCVLYLD